MHFNFHFTAAQIIWTLTFAAQMVLLVVLLGRDRVKRYPWFTTAVFLMALSRLAGRLLADRLPSITLSVIFITLADVAAILGFLVVVEMARRAFAGARRGVWFAWALGALVVAGGILALWGPWPSRQTLVANSLIAVLRLLQLGYMKADMLVDMLTVELGILVVLLGRRFGSGWRTHTQRIVIGLSTASLAQLTAQAVWQVVTKTAAPHSQAEYDKILGLRDKLFNADGAIYVAVFLWWIICLWMDEPGSGAEAEHVSPQPEYLLPEGAEAPVEAGEVEAGVVESHEDQPSGE
jgi:hypothetical protein